MEGLYVEEFSTSDEKDSPLAPTPLGHLMQLQKALEAEGQDTEVLTSYINEIKLKLEEGSYESIPYLIDEFEEFLDLEVFGK